MAKIPFANKHHILLHKTSPMVPLIIQDDHQRFGHVGRQHVLADLLNKFGFIKTNTIVCRMLSNCTFCRKVFSESIERKMADLSRERLKPDTPPFSLL